MSARSSLLAYALNAVWRRRAKAFALGGGLSFAVALVASVLFLTDALRAEADRARMATPDIVVQRLIAGRPSILNAADAEKLSGIASVSGVRPRVWGYLFLPALQGNVTVIGVHENAPGLTVVEGSLAEGRDRMPGAHEMIAGATLARALGLNVGDELGLHLDGCLRRHHCWLGIEFKIRVHRRDAFRRADRFIRNRHGLRAGMRIDGVAKPESDRYRDRAGEGHVRE